MLSVLGDPFCCRVAPHAGTQIALVGSTGPSATVPNFVIIGFLSLACRAYTPRRMRYAIIELQHASAEYLKKSLDLEASRIVPCRADEAIYRFKYERVPYPLLFYCDFGRSRVLQLDEMPQPQKQRSRGVGNFVRAC